MHHLIPLTLAHCVRTTFPHWGEVECPQGEKESYSAASTRFFLVALPRASTGLRNAPV